ncbi:MAG: hypothetical protein AAGK92_13855 [Pseudomonadota bacterium]
MKLTERIKHGLSDHAVRLRSINWFVLVLLGAVVSWMIVNIVIAMRVPVIPTLSDEYSYFLNVKAFVEHVWPIAVLDYDGVRSSVSGFSAHGPFYSVAYGAVPAVFRIEWDQWIVLQNSIMLALAALIAWRLPVTQDRFWRPTAALLVLSALVCLGYQTHFMVEPLHILGGVALAYLVTRPLSRNGFLALACATALLVFVFSLFRIVWVVGYLAVFVRANSVREILIAGLLSLTLFTTNMAFYSLFFASYPGGFFDVVTQMLFAGAWFDAASALHGQFVENWGQFFRFQTRFDYDVSKILYIVVLLACGAMALIEKRRDLLIVFLIYLCVFLLLFTLYNAMSWREHRILTPFYLLGGLCLLTTRAKGIVPLLVAAQLFAAPTTIRSSLSAFDGYRSAFISSPEGLTQALQDKERLARLPDRNADGKVAVGIEDEQFSLSSNPLLYALPTSNIEGRPMVYSIAVQGSLDRRTLDYFLSAEDCASPDGSSGRYKICPVR